MRGGDGCGGLVEGDDAGFDASDVGVVVERHGIVYAGHVEHVEGHGSGFKSDVAAHDSDDVEAAGSVDGHRRGAFDVVPAESAGYQSHGMGPGQDAEAAGDQEEGVADAELEGPA
mgnify:CR=1 FL=1